MVSVRELSFETGSWDLLSESDIYTPTVLEFGRGEHYHFAEIQGRELNLPSPTLPERKNLLGPRFTARYTTDGASFGFTLPYSALDESVISARLSLKGKTYEFKIPASSIDVYTSICLEYSLHFPPIAFFLSYITSS